MKFYIISDIHGAEPKLTELLGRIGEEIESGKAKLVILGDVYNHGPRNPLPEGYAPMKVAEQLNRLKNGVICIKGNCDSEVDEMISEFKMCARASVCVAGHTVVFTHGHKCNPEKPMDGLKAGDIVFYGHFHKPEHKLVDGVHYVCVGAVGMSPQGTPRSYAILDEENASVLPLDGGEKIFSWRLLRA